MSDNVIILGAGFSFDAGIPLLGGFVDKMWEYAMRKKAGDSPLSAEDTQIFEQAIKIRNELDSYHGRATFDDRNIEDILSILTFNVLAGARRDKSKLSAFNRAISRTIELSCSVTHPGVNLRGQNHAISTGPDLYRNFWLALFNRMLIGKDFPTLITFNYDLVLERSLLQVLINNSYYNAYNKRVPFDNIELNYYYKQIENPKYKIAYASYGMGRDSKQGTVLTESTDDNGLLKIDYLKLHGSLNFSESKSKVVNDGNKFTNSLTDPYILPPIFDKMSSMKSSEIWEVALQKIRKAKNIIIVGYSLPRTDIYMQYFLKTAVGPNLNLNNIYVFDPVLYSNSALHNDMISRYEDCFSPQIKKRINFHPQAIKRLAEKNKNGTAEHFVALLNEAPQSLLF